ncbi:MAG: hypothetical protein BWY76_02856 [bacterium ADurb.Bin429]|nr:MAG: hypothetical protein BWY76_02856 [bacterium ADurb.Bin429]
MEVNFTLTLRPPQVGIVQGTVTNAKDNTPIADGWVRAIVGPQPVPMPAEGMTRVASGESWGSQGVMIMPDEFIMYARTDAQGHYTLKVPPVVTALSVFAEGYAPAKTPVTVTAGAVTNADVALSPLTNTDVTLTGKVYQHTTNTERVPVPGATVYAQPANSDGGPVILSDAATAVIYSVPTDELGQYTMPLRPGVYLLYAEKDGLRSERVLRKVFADETQDFVLFGAGPVAGL